MLERSLMVALTCLREGYYTSQYSDQYVQIFMKHENNAGDKYHLHIHQLQMNDIAHHRCCCLRIHI